MEAVHRHLGHQDHLAAAHGVDRSVQVHDDVPGYQAEDLEQVRVLVRLDMPIVQFLLRSDRFAVHRIRGGPDIAITIQLVYGNRRVVVSGRAGAQVVQGFSP